MAATDFSTARRFAVTSVSLRPFALICLSAALLVAAIAVPVPVRSFLVGAGMGVVALALIAGAARFWRSLRRRVTLLLALRNARGDAMPIFLCDDTGQTLGRNRAATNLADTTGLRDWLARHQATPSAFIDQMSVLASNMRTVREIIDGPPTIRASIHDLGCGLFQWRLEIDAEGEAADDGSDGDDATGEPATGGSDPGDTSDLMETLPVPLLKISRDGQIRKSNAQSRRLLALSGGATPPIFDLVEGMGRPIADWIDDAFQGRGLLKPQIVRAAVPGQEIYIQISLDCFEEDGEALLIAVLNDATELKSLEAQFVQSQKMQAIGQLAGGVAHDFNNLLTAIGGHCDLLLLRHDQGDPAYADLKQIEQNANRAASLVGQLLAFSRKQNLRAQPLDLRDTMSDLTHLLNRLVEETVKLELSHEPGPKMIRADSRQLEQVIMNLVVNARDAMPDGGIISIRTHNTHLSAPMVRDRVEVPAGDYVVVKVADQGVGIEPDKLAKVFEPFYTTKRTGEGTGLGLSTAYGIVKQTGGYIFIDSAPGQGTTFSLYFPEHEPVPEETPRETALPTPAGHGHGDGVVLLVEDEAPVRAFASRALRMRGYTVLEAENADVALQTLEDPELAVDVFVTDVIMPGTDGPTWVRQALEARPDTRVVFVSGYAEESLAENQSRVPNSVFLPKPFSLNQLTSVVQEQFRQTPAARAN